MPELTAFTIFVVATSVLLLTPGPAVLYIVTRSIDQGRVAGIVSTLGIAVGTLFHVAAAAFGISALLVSSALLFNFVKYLGAAYLIYLGIRKLLVREELQSIQKEESRKLFQIFYQGTLVNLLNPKTALFFFAFLPQFVDSSRGSATVQILFLGATLVIMGLLSDGLYAWFAGSLGKGLRSNLRFLRAQRYFAGMVYIALGAATALSGAYKNK